MNHYMEFQKNCLEFGMVDVFVEVFIKDFNIKTKAQNNERTNIISEINALNKRYQNALLKKILPCKKVHLRFYKGCNLLFFNVLS